MHGHLNVKYILILYSQLHLRVCLLYLYLHSALLWNNTASQQQLINNSSEHESPWSTSDH